LNTPSFNPKLYFVYFSILEFEKKEKVVEKLWRRKKVVG
jgi:hypothetical protein